MSQKVNRMLAKGAESRERLIEAAIECFARNGFDGTSIRTIAETAGVTFQLIRHHFGSKDDLWTAAAFHLWDRAQVLLRKALSPPESVASDPKAALRHFVYVILEYNAQYPQLRRMFTHEYFANSHRYRNILRPYGRKFAEQQLTFFERLAATDALSRFSPREAMLVFRSLVAGSSILRDEYELLLGYPVDADASLDYQSDLLVHLLLEGRGLGSLGSERRAPETKRRLRRS